MIKMHRMLTFLLQPTKQHGKKCLNNHDKGSARENKNKFWLSSWQVEIWTDVDIRAINILIHLGYYNKMPEIGWLISNTIISHSPDGWEVQDQCTDRGSIAGSQTSVFLYMFSQGGMCMRYLWGFFYENCDPNHDGFTLMT